MIHPATARLAERNMTTHLITTQAATAAGVPHRTASRGAAHRAGLPPVVCLCGSTRFVAELNRRKIDLADYILVLNVGGYTGQSTRAEIRYAHATGKPVRYLDSPGPGEWACQSCGDAWFGTPPETGTCPGGCRAAA